MTVLRRISENGTWSTRTLVRRRGCEARTGNDSQPPPELATTVTSKASDSPGIGVQGVGEQPPFPDLKAAPTIANPAPTALKRAVNRPAPVEWLETRRRKGSPPVGGPGQRPPLPPNPKVITRRAPTRTHTDVEGSYTLTVTVPPLQSAEAVLGLEDRAVWTAGEPCNDGVDVQAANAPDITVTSASPNLMRIDTG